MEIDGKPVTNLDKYRVVSPVFPIGPLPEDNLLGLDEGATGYSVSDGYFAVSTRSRPASTPYTSAGSSI